MSGEASLSVDQHRAEKALYQIHGDETIAWGTGVRPALRLLVSEEVSLSVLLLRGAHCLRLGEPVCCRSLASHDV